MNDTPDSQQVAKRVDQILNNPAVKPQVKLALLTLATDQGFYTEHEQGQRLAPLERRMQLNCEESQNE